MPKLPKPREGEPLTVKDSRVEFSFFPTIKTVRRAGLHSKVYTTDAWSIIQACVRTTRPKALRNSALAFAEQAQEFYTAAKAASALRAKPLLLYYAFLNCAKALCLHRGNANVLGAVQHGLSEQENAGATLKAATVDAHPSTAARSNMFHEFMKTAVGYDVAAKRTFRIHDLIASSLIGHRLWCDAIQRQDCFLRLAGIDILHSPSSKEIWLRLRIPVAAITRCGVNKGTVTARGLGDAWKAIRPPQEGPTDQHYWEQEEPISYSGRPSDKLDELAGFARATFYRSLTLSEPFRTYYVLVPPKRFAKHHQLAARYALLFFLGSVTRYHPSDFDGYLDGKFGPFLSEYLASEPSQMLFEMACLFAKREVVAVGLA